MTKIKEKNGRQTKRSVEQQVGRSVERRLQQCPYSFVFRKVSCQFDSGRLTLRGSVPSFYLKQMLQELLRDTDHVEQINNEVDVVSSTGLSSVPPNEPR